MSDDLDSLLDTVTDTVTDSKKGAVPMKRTKKQKAAAEKAAERKAAQDLRESDKAAAQQLAQIVNLNIAGHSFAAIGAEIGMSGDEVEALVQRGAAQFVRTTPALRTFVRNFVSEKMTGLLDATYLQAIDTSRADQLDYVASVQKTLRDLSRLHGADAPTQSEVKVEASPEAVEQLVMSLAKNRGLAYDDDVFDAEIVEDLVDDSQRELEVSRNAVEESDGEDAL